MKTDKIKALYAFTGGIFIASALHDKSWLSFMVFVSCVVMFFTIDEKE